MKSNFIDTMHFRVSPLSYTSILKLFCLKLVAYSLTQFLYFSKTSLWMPPFLQVKFSLYSQFCSCQFLLELCNWYTVAIIQVVTSVAVMQALRLYYSYADGTFCYSYVGGSSCCSHLCDCFCWNYLVRSWSSNYMQVTFSALNTSVAVFIIFLQVGVSVATMQVVLSAVRRCFSCKMQFTVSVIAM